MSPLHLVCYAGVAVFLISVVARALKILRCPLHLRWELYPVAHEKGRARWGGSYMEEPEWWTKPREKSLLGELKVMVPEIREHNRSQWWRTFPFHFGLYLAVGATLLLVVGGVFGATATGGFFGTLIPILAYGGFGLGLLGAVALFQRRWSNSDYREYTNPVDFLNLGLFVAAFAVALAGQLFADPDFLKMRGFFAGLFTFGSHDLAPLQAAEVVLMTILAAYVPLTHMSHFFTKYFMYHDIRWSDEPLKVGGELEKKVGAVLQYRPTWAAAHVAGDGKKTWVDVAVSNGLPEEQKGGEN